MAQKDLGLVRSVTNVSITVKPVTMSAKPLENSRIGAAALITSLGRLSENSVDHMEFSDGDDFTWCLKIDKKFHAFQPQKIS